MPVRIVIADDHRILRAGLKTLLSGDPDIQVVGEATTGGEALKVAKTLHPDVLLMDIGMPGNEKLEATRQIIEAIPDIHVLMLTMYEDSALLKECLRIGAHGYIIKRAAESELIDAIHAVQRGIIYIHPSLMPAPVAKLAAIGSKKSLGVDTLTSR